MKYKGYNIEHIAKRDWIISKDNILCLNSINLIGDNQYSKNASTLTEAKQRIDNICTK